MEIIAGATAVVTGAGSGIGRSIALALANEGMNVVAADIELAAADRVSAEISALGVESVGVQTDVSSLDEVSALADTAYDRFGSVEVLVNNAGVTLRPFRASWDTSYRDFQWVINVNLWGVLNGHYAFVPRMLNTAGDKHIVNTSSITSLLSMAGHSAYSASKGAIDGFSRAAREELATQGIGLSILHPGAVRTPIVTSERLRKEEDRSEVRGVKPWQEYAGGSGNPVVAAAAAGQAPQGTDPDHATAAFEYIKPDIVGSLVVAGIRANRKHILTHPAPVADLLDEMKTVVEGAAWQDVRYSSK